MVHIAYQIAPFPMSLSGRHFAFANLSQCRFSCKCAAFDVTVNADGDDSFTDFYTNSRIDPISRTVA